MPAAKDDAKEADQLAEAEEQISLMEDLVDYYFGADKEVKMKQAFNVIEKCVSPLLDARVDIRSQDLRGRALFLRGRALSLLGGQERQAEELLTKSIKLNPKLVEAWNALGEAYWNMQDVNQAKKCFEQALEICGPNAVSLRNLSMALRAVGSDGATKSQNYADALAKAKEAVQLGPGDPLNWETLGNAYVGDFFINAKRPDEINRALIAYEKAERAYDGLGKGNPTLHFNRGMAAKYIEEYDLALRSFQKAHEIGAKGAAEEGKNVFDLVQRCAGCVERKHDFKVKRLKELAEGFPSDKESSRTLKEVQAKENEEASLVARVVSVVDRKDEVPVILICCDREGDFFAMSVYNAELQKLAESVVPMKSLLSVPRAKSRQIAVTIPTGKKWSYPCVIVGHPGDLTAVGGSSLGAAAQRSILFSTTAAVSGMSDKEDADGALGGFAPPARGSKAKQTKDPAKRFAECQQEMVFSARKAAKEGRGKEAVIEALVPCLRSLIDLELGDGAGKRIGRVEEMFARSARGEIFEEVHEDYGKRYAPGYVEGLTPAIPFREPEDLPWCATLKENFPKIRDELMGQLDASNIWVPGAYAQSNQSYAPDWRISGVLTADKWDERWPVTASVVKKLAGISPFEAFFARMPPHTTIAAHSDNLNYILTSHLAIELEPDTCSIRVGNHERSWEAGEMLVFDTTYIHSAWNDSGRDRYVLVVRFWHPGLSVEERRAIHMSHSLLAGTPDPEKLRRGAAESSLKVDMGH